MYNIEGLTEEPLLLGPLASAVKGEQPIFLRSAKIKLTARCNLRCEMCKYGKGLKLPELDGDRFEQVMDELRELGCSKVHFSGGEVLARDDFERIAGRAADAGMKVALTSNLTLLTKERAKTLMRHKINSVSTSLDGANAKTHERIRGVAGAFKRTLKGMAFLARERERRGRRTRVRVNFVMMRRNFREYPALVKLAAEHGATEVHPMPVDEKVERLKLTKRMIREYNEEIAPRVAEVRKEADMSLEPRMIFPFGRTHLEVLESSSGRYAGGFYQRSLCYAPYLHMFIAWDGAVYLCCMTNGRIEPLGNLGTQSVREVFLSDRFAQVREEMKAVRLPSCHACDMFLDENAKLEAALSGMVG